MLPILREEVPENISEPDELIATEPSRKVESLEKISFPVAPTEILPKVRAEVAEKISFPDELTDTDPRIAIAVPLSDSPPRVRRLFCKRGRSMEECALCN